MSGTISHPGSVYSKELALNGIAHTVSIFDCSPGGLLIRARDTRDNEHLLTPSTQELYNANIKKTSSGYEKLVMSLSLKKENNFIGLISSIEGISPAKPRSSPEQAENFINKAKAGKENFSEFLSKGLTELCRVKPVGLDAIEWLGKWMLENNPNKPFIVMDQVEN